MSELWECPCCSMSEGQQRKGLRSGDIRDVLHDAEGPECSPMRCPVQRSQNWLVTPVTYRLTLPKQWKIHNVFHAALLTPFKETTFHGTIETRLPPNLVNGQQEYEVEAILTHRHYRGKYQYLVKWKGYDSSENTWEPDQNLTNMEELLNNYKKSQETLRLSNPTIYSITAQLALQNSLFIDTIISMNSNDTQPTATNFAYTNDTLHPQIRLVPVQSDSSESDSDK